MPTRPEQLALTWDRESTVTLSVPALAMLMYVRRHVTTTLEALIVGMKYTPDLADRCLHSLLDGDLIERLPDTDIYVLTNAGRGYTP